MWNIVTPTRDIVYPVTGKLLGDGRSYLCTEQCIFFIFFRRVVLDYERHLLRRPR